MCFEQNLFLLVAPNTAAHDSSRSSASQKDEYFSVRSLIILYYNDKFN